MHDAVGSSVKKILPVNHTPSFKFDTRSYIAHVGFELAVNWEWSWTHVSSASAILSAEITGMHHYYCPGLLTCFYHMQGIYLYCCLIDINLLNFIEHIIYLHLLYAHVQVSTYWFKKVGSAITKWSQCLLELEFVSLAWVIILHTLGTHLP